MCLKQCAFFILAFCIFLCSCAGAKSQISPVLNGISFTAKIFYYDQEYTCIFTATKTGEYEVQFADTQTVVTFENDTVISEFSGLCHKYVTGSALDDSPVGLLVSVFRDAIKEEKKATLKNGNFLLQDRLAGIPYSFSFGATGLPISLEMPDRELYVEFQNSRIL